MQALRTAALLLFIALGAAADDGARFRAELVGTQEVPAIFAAGTAIFEMRVLDNDTRIEFQLTYENLTAPPLVAHVHFGQPGWAAASVKDGHPTADITLMKGSDSKTVAEQLDWLLPWFDQNGKVVERRKHTETKEKEHHGE